MYALISVIYPISYNILLAISRSLTEKHKYCTTHVILKHLNPMNDVFL